MIKQITMVIYEEAGKIPDVTVTSNMPLEEAAKYLILYAQNVGIQMGRAQVTKENKEVNDNDRPNDN
jgi:hypothetical protein